MSRRFARSPARHRRWPAGQAGRLPFRAREGLRAPWRRDRRSGEVDRAAGPPAATSTAYGLVPRAPDGGIVAGVASGSLSGAETTGSGWRGL